jgi:hypothetical protein
MELLEIIVAKHNNGYWQDEPWKSPWQPLPNEKIYHEVITDQEFVQRVHETLSSLESARGTSLMQRPFYDYLWRFATDGRTTLIYSGQSNYICWRLDDTVNPRSVVGPRGDPVRELMFALHDRFGVPFWAAEDS